jgi:dolichol-phosphate mannosyltransferase
MATGTRPRRWEVVIGREADLMSSIRRDLAHLHFPQGFSPNDRQVDPEFARDSTLSIVIPARNEAENLAPLVEEVISTFRPLMERTKGWHRLDGFEIVVVDDGSTDRTRVVLERLTECYPELRRVTLARNAGQSAAMIAGFWASRGEWVGSLDADLQNPPSELARLWDALPGHDAALGWRVNREDCWTKRLTSRLANVVRNLVLGQSIRDTGCSVRIFPREIALRLPVFHGMHRFFGSLLIREGCRIVQVPVSHRPRIRGKSHYHFGNRSIRVVIDLLGVAWLLRRPVQFELISADHSNQEMVASVIVGRKELR